MKFDTSRLVYREDLSDENSYYIEVLPPKDKEDLLKNVWLTGNVCYVFLNKSKFTYVKTDLKTMESYQKDFKDDMDIQDLTCLALAISKGYDSQIRTKLKHLYSYNINLCNAICDSVDFEIYFETDEFDGSSSFAVRRKPLGKAVIEHI